MRYGVCGVPPRVNGPSSSGVPPLILCRVQGTWNDFSLAIRHLEFMVAEWDIDISDIVIFSMTRSMVIEGNELGMLQLLLRCRSTDPRDKLYAL